MTRQVFQTGRFEKELSRAHKRRKNTDKLWAVVEMLENDQPLPAKHWPHKLKGQWHGLWECHIEPDWLLIYDLIDDDKVTLMATGTHSDLFK